VNSIQYFGYNFPEPLPFLAESSTPIYASGVYDHSTLDVKLVGFLTGRNICDLNSQKQAMISGLLNEYEDLSIQISGNSKTYSKVLPISIDFSDSDLTTVLPYSVSFLVFTGESFSQFFGVSSPKNEWSFSEQENQIVQVTHTISAQGEKINDQEPLQNAIDFVTSNTGFQNVAPLLVGDNAFLKSRNETINRKTANYSITEVYHFDGSDREETPSAIVTYQTTVNFNKDGGLNAGINGTIYGAFDGDLVDTSLFTPEQATEALTNDVAASQSDYESEAFSFIRSGPSTYSYNINSGTNTIDFTFTYMDIDNIDQIGNIGHKYKLSVQASKDNANLTVSAEGELFFNSIDSVVNIGLYENSVRFQEIESVYNTIDPYNIAYQGLQDFKNDASAYSCPDLTLNPKEKSRTVNKDPVNNRITYNYTYDTSTDLSPNLQNARVSITDKIPLRLSNVVPTLGGFAAQVISDRTLGEYTVSATADEGEDKIGQLKNLVGSYSTKGEHKQTDNYSIGVNNISYTISKFY
jgi:hypothetical protein